MHRPSQLSRERGKGKKKKKGEGEQRATPEQPRLGASCLGTRQLLASAPDLPAAGRREGAGAGWWQGWEARSWGCREPAGSPARRGPPPRMSPGGAGRSLPCVSFDPGMCAPALAEMSRCRAAWKGQIQSKKGQKMFLATSTFRPALSREGKIVVKTTSVWFPQITTFLLKNETGREGVPAASSWGEAWLSLPRGCGQLWGCLLPRDGPRGASTAESWASSSPPRCPRSPQAPRGAWAGTSPSG